MAHLQRTLLETVSLQIHFLMKTLLWLKIVLFTSRAAEDKRANLNNYTDCIYPEEGTFSQHISWYQKKKQPLFLYQDSTVTQ